MLTFQLRMTGLKKNTDLFQKNMHLNPGASQLLPFEHATGDHSKQLGPCLYVVENC